MTSMPLPRACNFGGPKHKTPFSFRREYSGRQWRAVGGLNHRCSVSLFNKELCLCPPSLSFCGDLGAYWRDLAAGYTTSHMKFVRGQLKIAAFSNRIQPSDPLLCAALNCFFTYIFFGELMAVARLLVAAFTGDNRRGDNASDTQWLLETARKRMHVCTGRSPAAHVQTNPGLLLEFI